MTTGAYIHVPFCHEKCDYCSFYSLPVSERKDFLSLADQYTEKVIEEIKEVLGEGSYTLDTMYFGGGTPALLPPENLEKIVDALGHFGFVEESAEISIETNPGLLTAPGLEILKSLGFSRVTMGLQTIDPEAHRTIGRQGTLCSAETLEEYFSVPGIDLCLDIIAGIPGHDPDLYLEQLEAITAFRPPHLSVYLLSIEEGTPLAGRLAENEEIEENQARAFRETDAFLTGSGYLHYEISNYALPGKESRHNLKYWRYLPYAGFGPGAHSFLQGRRWANVPDLAGYLKDGPVARKEDRRSREQSMVEFLMTGLRLMAGIKSADFIEQFGEPIPAAVMSRARELAGREELVLTSPQDREKLSIALAQRAIINADRIIYRLLEPLVAG